MTIPRPFSVHYNPYTQTIEVINGKEQIVNMVRTLRSKKELFKIGLFFIKLSYEFFIADDMDVIVDALRKTELVKN